MYARRLGLVLGFLLSASLTACPGDSDGPGGAGASGGGSDTGSDTSEYSLRIEPDAANAVVSLDEAPMPVAFAAFGDDGTGERDVTAEVSWSVDPALGTMAADGMATVFAHGGSGLVTAFWNSVSANATLTVKLTGDVFLPGTDPATKDDFDAAGSDPDTNNAPAIEYPNDGVVLPRNLPPIEAQWSQAADNDTYRVRLTAPEVLDVAFYVAARELLFPKDAWTAIAASAPDAPMTLTIEGLGPSNVVRTSAPRAVIVSNDSIDDSAIYVWQSSTGSFRVLDIVNGTDIALPTNSPPLQAGQPCSGCHRISRDGKRFSFSYNGGNFEFGTLVYDEANQIFASAIAPTPGIRGTYATFNPNEATSTPAMIVTLPDTVPQNSPGTVRLDMVHPETNQVIPSDIAAMLAAIDPAVGHAALMPDWSPTGDFVVFAAYNSDANWVRLLGDDVVLASIVEAPVSYSTATGSFSFGAPTVLVQTMDSVGDTGENNFLPTISPDGSAVAFTRSSGWWSIKTQQSLINLTGRIALVRRSDGTTFELAGGASPAGGTWSNTWPQWAPTIGSRYLWLAFGSERPYGHRLTPSSPENAACGLVQGQQQCKHLWVMAIDRAKLESGTADPSVAPFFIPGQTLAAQYVSPQWTKAVLPVPQ